MNVNIVSLVIASIAVIFRGLMAIPSFPHLKVNRRANRKFNYAAIPVRDDPIYRSRRYR